MKNLVNLIKLCLVCALVATKAPSDEGELTPNQQQVIQTQAVLDKIQASCNGFVHFMAKSPLPLHMGQTLGRYVGIGMQRALGGYGFDPGQKVWAIEHNGHTARIIIAPSTQRGYDAYFDDEKVLQNSILDKARENLVSAEVSLANTRANWDESDPVAQYHLAQEELELARANAELAVLEKDLPELLEKMDSRDLPITQFLGCLKRMAGQINPEYPSPSDFKVLCFFGGPKDHCPANSIVETVGNRCRQLKDQGFVVTQEQRLLMGRVHFSYLALLLASKFGILPDDAPIQDSLGGWVDLKTGLYIQNPPDFETPPQPVQGSSSSSAE